MKKALAILAVVVMGVVGSIASLGVDSAGVGSDSGKIGSACNMVATSSLCENCRLVVCVMPLSSAKASHPYVVNLYEKGKLRDSSTISWSESQIEMREYATVCFHLSDAEVDAYEFAPSDELGEVFSIRVQRA
jgi:hypothetical protein